MKSSERECSETTRQVLHPDSISQWIARWDAVSGVQRKRSFRSVGGFDEGHGNRLRFPPKARDIDIAKPGDHEDVPDGR